MTRQQKRQNNSQKLKYFTLEIEIKKKEEKFCSNTHSQTNPIFHYQGSVFLYRKNEIKIQFEFPSLRLAVKMTDFCIQTDRRKNPCAASFNPYRLRVVSRRILLWMKDKKGSGQNSSHFSYRNSIRFLFRLSFSLNIFAKWLPFFIIIFIIRFSINRHYYYFATIFTDWMTDEQTDIQSSIKLTVSQRLQTMTHKIHL